MTDKLAVVFGGSGFVGRNVVRELAKRGWRVRAAVRRPHHAQFLRTMGAVGQVQLQQTNVRYRGSIEQALKGADAVINLVGILYQRGGQRFDAVQGGGAAAIAELSAKHGVKQFVHVSAIGADAASDSLYARSKAAGEKAVRQAMPGATVLRPSIIFGPEDQFFNKFAAMASSSPVLPLFGGGATRFQPVYVDDVADAICAALENPKAAGRTYELGGPRVYTFKELLELMGEETGRKRILLPIPFALAAPIGMIGEAIGWVPIFSPPVTRDQIRLLKKDNIVGASGDDSVGTIADLGVRPASVEAIVPTYMVRFRKYGQFTERLA